jgi:hypothetical protein
MRLSDIMYNAAFSHWYLISRFNLNTPDEELMLVRARRTSNDLTSDYEKALKDQLAKILNDVPTDGLSPSASAISTTLALSPGNSKMVVRLN